MDRKGFILWLFTESPLHAGSGTGLGEIDLPLQRERTTGFPFIQASGVKGALRAYLQPALEKDYHLAIFGPETTGAHEHAGALAISDARLLLFPVRSLVGVWAWITCPLALHRYVRDCERAGVKDSNIPPIPTPSKMQAFVTSENEITHSEHLILEDLAYKASVQDDDEVRKWAEHLVKKAFHGLPEFWQNSLQKHMAILSDEDFQFFVENATEVITRVRIDQESKTVAQGALWTEELLPAETLLYTVGLMEASHQHENGRPKFLAKDLMKVFGEKVHNKRLQLGGDSTLGRGWVFASITPETNHQTPTS